MRMGRFFVLGVLVAVGACKSKATEPVTAPSAIPTATTTTTPSTTPSATSTGSAMATGPTNPAPRPRYLRRLHPDKVAASSFYDDKKTQAEKTVFLGDRNAEKMQDYFKAHKGRRVFFVIERVRFEALRQLLPAEARSTLQILDQSNNKLYLASAQL